MQMKPIVALVISGVMSFGSVVNAQIACPTNTCAADDYSCRATYNRQMSVCRAGAANQNATNTGIQPPNQPIFENCNTGTTVDSACTTRNQVAQASYDSAKAAYDNIKAQELKNQEALRAQQYASAMEAARAAQSQNEQGKSKYNIASMLNMVASVALIPACNSSGAACAAMAAFAIFSGLAAQQAGSHDSVKYDACRAANQISTNPQGCGTAPTPFNPSNWPANTTQPLTDNFDNKGNCIGTPAQCQQILDNLPPGTNIKGAMDLVSKFAGGGPMKMNPDGSVTLKNGKTFKPSDFDSVASMVAAGMTQAQATSLMDQMNKQKALADIDTKKDLKNLNGDGGGDPSLAGGGGANTKIGDGTGGNGDASGAEKGAGKRNVAAAEGLTRDFNGELIGAAGDDIFKMMNRRYRLKWDQDSFIGAK